MHNRLYCAQFTRRSSRASVGHAQRHPPALLLPAALQIAVNLVAISRIHSLTEADPNARSAQNRAQELKRRMDAGEDFTIIDVRNPQARGQSDTLIPEALRIRQLGAKASGAWLQARVGAVGWLRCLAKCRQTEWKPSARRRDSTPITEFLRCPPLSQFLRPGWDHRPPTCELHVNSRQRSCNAIQESKYRPRPTRLSTFVTCRTLAFFFTITA